MKDIYKPDEDCMAFSDETLEKYFFDKGCIIYEGYLRDKTHEQILGIFFDLFRILYGTKKIKFKERLVARAGFYRINAYTVKLTKPNMKRQIIQFENIRFLIN